MPISVHNYLVANEDIIAFHDKITGFAIDINQAIANKYINGHPSPVTNTALWIITADITSLHKALFDLCVDGWSMVTGIVLRSMLEMFISLLVITKNINDSDIYSFKYMHNFHKKLLKNPNSSKIMRDSAQKKIDEYLGKLNRDTRKKAECFLKDKFKYYWYLPEYKGPKDILTKMGYDNLIPNYELFSGAAHGGLLGLALLKGQADQVHPNPRADKHSQDVALSFSNRITLDSLAIRGKFEGLDIDDIYTFIFTELKNAGDKWVEQYWKDL